MTEKLTKRDYFLRLRDRVSDDSELVEFINHELDLLARKNVRKTDKPSAKQVQNATMADLIYDTMQEGTRYTVSEIHKMIPAFSEFSGNKVSALVRSLKLDGRVIRTEEKGKAYFTKA